MNILLHFPYLNNNGKRDHYTSILCKLHRFGSWVWTESLEGKGYYCIIQIKSSELGIAQDISQFYSDVRDNCIFETIALQSRLKSFLPGTAAQQSLQGRFRESRTPRKVQPHQIWVLRKIAEKRETCLKNTKKTLLFDQQASCGKQASEVVEQTGFQVRRKFTFTPHYLWSRAGCFASVYSSVKCTHLYQHLLGRGVKMK